MYKNILCDRIRLKYESHYSGVTQRPVNSVGVRRDPLSLSAVSSCLEEKTLPLRNGPALRHYMRDKRDRIQEGKQVSKHISEITRLATKCSDQSCLESVQVTERAAPSSAEQRRAAPANIYMLWKFNNARENHFVRYDRLSVPLYSLYQIQWKVLHNNEKRTA